MSNKILSFHQWMEQRVEPARLRKITIDYLGLRDKIDAKEGLAIPLEQLDVDMIRDKVMNWNLLSDQQREAAERVLNQPNANLGDLVDAIANEGVPLGPEPTPGLDLSL